MALFCVAIRRDSVSFFRFLFCSHVRVFSCEISPVCCLKSPILFSFSFFFYLYVCCHCCTWLLHSYFFSLFNKIFQLMNLRSPLPSFLDTFSLGCNALWIVINFSFASLCSSFVYLIVQNILQKDCQSAYPFDELFVIELVFEKLCCSSEILFSNCFLHLPKYL